MVQAPGGWRVDRHSLIFQTYLIFWITALWMCSVRSAAQPRSMAAPGANIGDSNFFELAIANRNQRLFPAQDVPPPGVCLGSGLCVPFTHFQLLLLVLSAAQHHQI